jgi:hypothetical protein
VRTLRWTYDCAAAVALAVQQYGKLEAVLHWAARHSTTHWNYRRTKGATNTVIVGLGLGSLKN